MTDTAFDDLQVEPPIGPPTRLLILAAGVLGVAAVLTPFASTTLRLIAYILAALLAAVIIGMFRYLDGRLKVRANYRAVGWAGPAAAALLAVAWLLACGNAWLLATTWAR